MIYQTYIKEALDDRMDRIRIGWTLVHEDYDTGIKHFAVLWLAPFALAWWWWQDPRRRMVIERWMRWRLADIPAGYSCMEWRNGLRPMAKWTRRKTRPHSLSDEYKAIEERFKHLPRYN